MGLTTQVEKLLESLNQTVAGANIEWLSLEAHKLLSEVRQTNQNLNNLLTGPKAQGIVQNADDAVNDIKRLVQTIEQPATETLKSLEDAAASIDRFSKELDRAVEEVPETVSQARTALRRLDNLIAIPQQNLEETMENIRVITENLRALSEEAKQYPAYTFFGKPPQKQQKGNQR
jgi:phospholipid/cholesterol/gamma-HCH transport system substrate-binding protein/paraquat-inducible protein B